jgi:hypothetical protein
MSTITCARVCAEEQPRACVHERSDAALRAAAAKKKIELKRRPCVSIPRAFDYDD